ncbi:MAG: PBP1A family penicillin-binding protein [Candidatus Wildermuthbacteria bacterium]|nr:PBP1A family penicillin-binding protein [Candidatus Wildermuthbacteria bacterium]
MKSRFGKLKTVFLWALKISFALFFLGSAAVALLFFYYAKDLPRPERYTEAAFSKPTQIYDRTGTVLLYELYEEERREPTPLSEIPLALQRAVIATEDDEFYKHPGVDVRGMTRAVVTNIWRRSAAQGGSTITQQLVRTVFLSREKTVERKIKELMITIELERRYTKDELLGFYLNQVPLGANLYGVGAASPIYFGKPVQELTLPESAVLAAMIQAPTYYSPFGTHKEALFNRKNYVLGRMEELGFITKQEAETAKAKEIKFAAANLTNIKAPHFSLYVMEQLFSKYSEDYVRKNGFKVYTTLDWKVQKAAEEAITKFAKQNASHNANNSAIVAIDPNSGEILAMVGSKDWHAPQSFPQDCISGKTCLFDPKVNVVTSYPGRQPGSTFKPFVYATAFKKGVSDETIVIDELKNFGIWGGKEYIPQNYDGNFRGPVSLRSALAQSLNIPAVTVMIEMAGIPESIQTAKDMGITTLNREPSFYGPSLVLGGGEVRLLDMASAYGVFATDGRRVPPVAIMKIVDQSGSVIDQNSKTSATVLAPEVARTITSILSDNNARAPVFGYNSSLVIPGYNVAVKTGTTQEYRDAWTVGYTPQIVAGVWTGNNNNDPIRRGPGIELAAPIWHDFMVKVLPFFAPPSQPQQEILF